MKTRILLVLAFLTPLAGWAIDPVPMDVKLGLWETTLTNQSDMSAMVPPEMLSKLTPAQRAQLEAGMSGRGGARTSTTKHCVTRETINEAFSSASNTKETKCTRTFVTSTSTKQAIHMECTSATMKTSSDIQVEAIDRENTKASIVTTTGDGGGRGRTMKMEMTSKWLGAECGDVGQKKN